MTSKFLLSDIQRKIKRHRIESSLTQKDLADKTGLSLRSIQRFENGDDISLENFLKIAIALKLDEGINVAIPDLELRPTLMLEKERKNIKQRVRKKTKPEEQSKSRFVWGDEK